MRFRNVIFDRASWGEVPRNFDGSFLIRHIALFSARFAFGRGLILRGVHEYES